jgi:hypothetical protein
MSISAMMRARVRPGHAPDASLQANAFLDPKNNGLSEDGQIVLAHLKRFAKLNKPPISPGATGDLFQIGRMVGRQETVQMIVEALHLDERTLTNLQEDYRDE